MALVLPMSQFSSKRSSRASPSYPCLDVVFSSRGQSLGADGVRLCLPFLESCTGQNQFKVDGMRVCLLKLSYLLIMPVCFFHLPIVAWFGFALENWLENTLASSGMDSNATVYR